MGREKGRSLADRAHQVHREARTAASGAGSAIGSACRSGIRTRSAGLSLSTVPPRPRPTTIWSVGCSLAPVRSRWDRPTQATGGRAGLEVLAAVGRLPQPARLMAHTRDRSCRNIGGPRAWQRIIRRGRSPACLHCVASWCGQVHCKGSHWQRLRQLIDVAQPGRELTRIQRAVTPRDDGRRASWPRLWLRSGGRVRASPRGGVQSPRA